MTRLLCIWSTLTVGGAERQLALLLPELRERGFDPYVATLRHKGPNFDALVLEGVDARFVGMRSRADAGGIARAYRLWRLRPDIVLSSSVDAQVIGHAVARRVGAPHVTVEHGGAGLPRAPHRRLLVQAIAPRIDRVVAVSATQLSELRALGFRPDRITVIPNGIPQPAPARPPDEVRAELGIAPDDVIALLVATLRPEKRGDRFVECVTRAHARDARLRGVIAGGGPELAHIQSLTAATGGVVRALGSRSDVPDLIAAADIVCLTSAFEGLPLIVLEAMALGKPVLAPMVGGIPEAVADGVSGRLVEPDDVHAFVEALLSLARTPEERHTLGEAARRRYEQHYTVEVMADGYADLLSAVAGVEPVAAAR